jgi:SAM-dependent methyltransferase
MDILNLNKKAWNTLATDTAWRYVKHPQYLKVFNKFCALTHPHGTVLDIGCGPGIPITKTLIDHGFGVIGIDIAENMLARAKDNVPAAEFVCASVTDIQYESRFDGIVASFSLIGLDLDSFQGAASKIKRALKPAGTLFIALNEPRPGQPAGDGCVSSVSGEEMYGRRFTKQQVLDAFSGFRLLQHKSEKIKNERYGTEHTSIFLFIKSARLREIWHFTISQEQPLGPRQMLRLARRLYPAVRWSRQTSRRGEN